MRVAVVGAGLMGWRHAEAFASVRGVQLSDVMDVNPEAANRLARQYRARAHVELGGLMEARPDIVVVATGDRQHREVAAAALTAGCHVLIEKPLASTVEDAEFLVGQAAAADSVVAVGHQLRFDARYASCVESVRQGCLGELNHAAFRRNSSVAGAWKYGATTTLASHVLIHDVDLLHAITGHQVAGVWARGSKHSDSPNPLDSLLVVADLSGGAVASFECSWVLPDTAATALDASATFIGTDGQLRVETEMQGLSVLTSQGRAYPDTVRYSHLYGQIAGLMVSQAMAFVRAVDSGDPSGLCTVEQAASAVRVVGAVEHSLALGEYTTVSGPVQA